MAMYTRCPACKSEIAFEPPANIASLPEDYKHRIKCPSCGVTIGVKLNKIERQPVQETPLAVSPIETPAAEQPVTVPERSLDKPKKKAGTGRNIFMMIVSLLFIAASVLAYLINTNTVNIGESTFGLGYIDGIACWELLVTDFANFKAMFEADMVAGILAIMPMALFTLSCITFIVALISACGKKYSRAFNLIWAIIIFVAGLAVIFTPYFAPDEALAKVLFDGEDKISIFNYLQYMFQDGKAYCIVAPAALGLIQLLFSFFFLRSLEIDDDEE